MEYRERKNIRLPGYDYSRVGGYFVTVCTEGRRCVLSRVLTGNKFVRADIRLTELGNLAVEALKETSLKTGIRVKDYIVMPNHIHMILFIREGKESVSLGQFIGAFKSLTLHHWRKICNQRGVQMGKIWQRNYYEHILRNEADYREKLRYIDENPDAWIEDELYTNE